MLESIDHPDLTRLILQYLFGIHVASSDSESSARPTALARRRKSEGLIFHLANRSDNPSPDLFNLADLILGSLESKNQQTLAATLRLLSVIFRKHHPHALILLLKTRTSRDSDEQRTVDSQERQIDNLLSMAGEIADTQSCEGSYERYLQDSRIRLENHSCTARLLSLPDTGSVRPSTIHIKAELAMKKHTLVAEDPLLLRLLGLMENFYLNDVETNLGLTEVLIDLASCGYTRIEGWFLADPSDCTFSDDMETGAEVTASLVEQKGESNRLPNGQSLLDDPSLSRRKPSWQTEDKSPVFSTIHKLVQKTELFREEIQDFGTCLKECRAMVAADDGAGWALPNTIGERGILQDIPDTSPNRTQNKGQMESISERLRSERLSGSDSRNSSPRGRQLDLSSTPTLVGRLSHLYVSPVRSLSPNSSRAYSPSPLRNISIASTPPKPNILDPRSSSALLRTVQIVGKVDNNRRHLREMSSSEASSLRSESVEPGYGAKATREVTSGHLLTNVIILQEFILELAALMDIRAGMFEEVKFL